MNKQVLIVSSLIMGGVLIQSRALADATFIEMPAATCNSIDNSTQVHRSQNFFFNNSSSSSIDVICPVPAPKTLSLISPPPTTVAYWQIVAVDGSSGNISCFPVLRFDNGTELNGPTLSSSGNSGTAQLLQGNDPFAGVDISGALTSLVIRCTLPKSDRFFTGVSQYAMKLQYSH